jgi:hypothetical protein
MLERKEVVAYFILPIPLYVKSKAIPIVGHGGLWGCEMLRIPHYVGSQVAVSLSALHTGHALLPRNIFLLLVLICVRG